MAKDVKQKIVLTGEKEYSSALKEANRNIKTMQSALKAETAELGKNATAQDKAKVKAENLKKQIAEQEKIVKAHAKALEEVREKYADNEDAIQQYERRLNQARETLANMRNSLDDVSDGFQQIQQDAGTAVVATHSVAEALQSIGDAGSGIADSIEAVFSGMIDVITDAASEVWALISETAARANGWTDVAGYWNTDAQKIQQWARAVAASQNSFDDLQNSVSKLVLGDHDKIFKLTGVSWLGDIDEWQYAMDVLSSISGMEHAQRNSALEELFGEKRSTRMMDLLNDWGDILGMLDEFNGNESGFGMNDEQLSTMNDLWVEIGKIEQKWIALKENVAGGLGIAALDLAVNVEGTLDGIAEFLNAKDEGEREAALDKIRTNVEEFFRRLAEVIRVGLETLNEIGTELQGSEDPVTQMIGNILVGVTDSLQWILDNQEAVKTAFEAIFGIWLAARIAAVAGQLGNVVMQLKTIQMFKTLGGIKDALSKGGGGGGTQTEPTKQTGGGAGLLRTILESDTLRYFAGGAAFWGTLFENAIRPQGNDQYYTPEEEKAERDAHAQEYAVQEFIAKMQHTPELKKQLEEQILNDSFLAQWFESAAQKATLEAVEKETNMQAAAERIGAFFNRMMVEAELDAEEKKDQIKAAMQSRFDRAAEAQALDEEEAQREAEAKAMQAKYAADQIGQIVARTLVQAAIEAAQNEETARTAMQNWWDQRTKEPDKYLPEEIVEDELLDNVYSRETKEGAAQDWWDAYRNAMNGTDSWEEENAAFEWMEEALGDDFAEVFYNIMQKLDEVDDYLNMDDLPTSWLNSDRWNGGSEGEGISSGDLEGFRGLPGQMRQAAKEGTAAGISGIKVYMDGAAVGRLVAPTVSEYIAAHV